MEYPYLGVSVQVLEVSRSHSTADLALTDGSKGEVVPLAYHLVDGLCLRVTTLADSLGHARSLEGNLLDDFGCVDVGGCWRRHDDGLVLDASQDVLHENIGRGEHDPFASIILESIKLSPYNLRTTRPFLCTISP